MSNNHVESINIQSKHISSSIENEVKSRYANGAIAPEAALCCPTDYDASDLKLLPDEIIEKDYGCGDPSQYIKPGETVLDLGSGGGKICYIISKKVGATGRVIGIDFNDTMLALANKYKDEMAAKYGFGNVDFRKGKIQDLGLNLNKVQKWLNQNHVKTVDDITLYENYCDLLRKNEPLVASDVIDVIVSNCVLNLVQPKQKEQLFDEMYRVLKPGGRCVISDIVCDEYPTEKILANPALWSGCISGAFREDDFLKMFSAAGFYGIEILKRESEPWQIIDGVVFRSVTVQAYKGNFQPSLDRKQAVIYKGPWRMVTDDDGHVYDRGAFVAVSDQTFKRVTDKNGPYEGDIIGLEPNAPIRTEDAKPFDATINKVRHPRELKGLDYDETKMIDGTSSCCVSDGDCC